MSNCDTAFGLPRSSLKVENLRESETFVCNDCCIALVATTPFLGSDTCSILSLFLGTIMGMTSDLLTMEELAAADWALAEFLFRPVVLGNAVVLIGGAFAPTLRFIL